MLKNLKIGKISPLSKDFKLNNVLKFRRARSFKEVAQYKKPSQGFQSSSGKGGEIAVETNPADYIKVFANPTSVELVAGTVEQADLVITAAYKQVFGNVHLMESERFPEAESQLRSGQITVMEFIRQLAKSARYRALVFERNSNLRAIELNFKHLLGRAPESHAEISDHIARLTNEGCDAEIDSYIDSDEYFQVFGADIVPYYRGYQTQTGRKLVGYTHSFQIMRGASSSDVSTPLASYETLETRLFNSDAFTTSLNQTDIAEKVRQLAPPPRPNQSGVSKYCPKTACPTANIYEPEQIIRRTLNLHVPSQQSQPSVDLGSTSPKVDLADPIVIIRNSLKLDPSAQQSASGSGSVNLNDSVGVNKQSPASSQPAQPQQLAAGQGNNQPQKGPSRSVLGSLVGGIRIAFNIEKDKATEKKS